MSEQFDIWADGYAKAFHLLLAATAPGLWNNSELNPGYGPDILGHIYESWSSTSPKWLAQYFTSWPVCRLMSQLVIPDGKQQIHNRLKKALTHPDNVLGFATLMAGMVIPDDDQAAYDDWFFNQLIPAALWGDFFEPITLNDPAIGSGRTMLAGLMEFPAWAVQRGLVRISGMDIDHTCYMMSSIQVLLYGLNGFSIKLELAVADGLAARQKSDIPAKVYAAQNGSNGQPPVEPSFQTMMQVAVQGKTTTHAKKEVHQLVA